METTLQIIRTVLPVLLMLIIGMISRSFGIFSREGISAMKKLAVNITLPAVMLNAFATMNYSLKNVLVTLMMFGLCLAGWALGKLAVRIFRIPQKLLPYLTTGFEAGMLGYSLFLLLYGPEEIGSFAAVDLGQVLFVFTLYKILLGSEGQGRPSASQLVREMFTSPTVIAILAGVLLGASGLYAALTPSGISSCIDACTDFVSAPTGAVILLTIGYDLVPSEIVWGRVAKAVAVRVAVMALLRVAAGLLVRLIGMGSSLDAALNVMFILPPPYVLPVFADDEKERIYISSAISVLTIVTVICFAVLAGLRG